MNVFGGGLAGGGHADGGGGMLDMCVPFGIPRVGAPNMGGGGVAAATACEGANVSICCPVSGRCLGPAANSWLGRDCAAMFMRICSASMRSAGVPCRSPLVSFLKA